MLFGTINEHGINADPEKTLAIKNMNTPKSITDLRRFIGMVNQLRKFSHKISEISQPLRASLSTKNTGIWDQTKRVPSHTLRRDFRDQPTSQSLTQHQEHRYMGPDQESSITHIKEGFQRSANLSEPHSAQKHPGYGNQTKTVPSYPLRRNLCNLQFWLYVSQKPTPKCQLIRPHLGGECPTATAWE